MGVDDRRALIKESRATVPLRSTSGESGSKSWRELPGSVIREVPRFAVKGTVVDLAVALVIGTASQDHRPLVGHVMPAVARSAARVRASPSSRQEDSTAKFLQTLDF